MTGLAREYGEGLYELARDEDLSLLICEQMDDIATLLKQQPEFIRLLCSRAVERQKRLEIVDETFGGHVHPYVTNFMKLLVQKEHFDSFPLCCEWYHRRFNEDNGIVEAMESGTVDVGIMPPATYAQARDMGVAEAILSSTLTDYDQETEQLIPGSVTGNFKAEVLVRADSGIDGYEGLAEKTIAYLGASSASGYIYPVAEMKKLGIDTEKCTWINITSIPSAILAVINGQVDACFTFEGSRYVFATAVLDDNGNPYDLYEVLKVAKLSDGDIPNDAVAVNPKLSESTQAAITDAFLKMASDEEGLKIMSTWGHTGYVPAIESDYDTIAEYIALAAD